MFRVAVVVLAMMAGAMAIAAGCSARPEGAAKQELVYAGVGDPAEVQIIRTILSEFEKQYPQYHVRFVHVPGDPYWTKLKIMFAGGVPPDVMYMGGGYVQELAAAGLLMDVRSINTMPDCHVNWDDFVPAALDSYTYQGRLYGIPRDVAPMAMYYNKDIFDAAGVAYPADDWMRDDYLRIAKRLTNPQRHQFGCQIRIWDNELLPTLWQSGGRLLDQSRTHVLINSPESVAACRFLQDLQYKYKVAPTPQQATGIPLFNQGKVAMMLGGYWEAPTFRTLSFRWGAAPLPRDKFKVDMMSGTAYSIAKATRNPTGAWRLAVFMTSSQVQRQMALDHLALPARLHALRPADLANDPVLATFMNCVPESRSPPFVPRWLEIESVINRHFDRLMRNIETPEQMTSGLEADLTPLVGASNSVESR